MNSILGRAEFLVVWGYYSPFRRRWESKWSSKCTSKSWMVGRFQSTANPKSQFKFAPGDSEEFKFNQNLNSNLYREIQRNFEFPISAIDRNLLTIQDSICNSTIISSLIFHGTGCTSPGPSPKVQRKKERKSKHSKQWTRWRWVIWVNSLKLRSRRFSWFFARLVSVQSRTNRFLHLVSVAVTICGTHFDVSGQ